MICLDFSNAIIYAATPRSQIILVILGERIQRMVLSLRVSLLYSLFLL